MKKAFAAAAFTLMTAVAAIAQDKKEIIVNYPTGENRSFDCNKLVQLDGKLWLTAEAAEALDINNQDFITDPKLAILSNDPATRKNQLSQITYQAVVHFSRMHKDCVAMGGKLELSLGKTPEQVEQLYGKDWQQKIMPCTLIQVFQGCKTELGMK